MANGLDSTKTGARASHEAIDNASSDAIGVDKTAHERIDHEALEASKRAQNRIHNDETKLPGSSIFTK
jgi:ribosomal protein L16/L10AE